MRQKHALAMFNPQHPVEAAFQSAYHECTGGWMTKDDMDRLVMGMSATRGINDVVKNHMGLFVKALFAVDNDTEYWYYPCDLIEIRGIFENKQVRSYEQVLLFSPKVARQILNKYSIFIAIKKSSLKGKDLRGAFYSIDPAIDIQPNSVKVMVKDSVPVSKVKVLYNTLKELGEYVPVYWITDIPGIKPTKVAMNDQIAFKVSIPKFEIHEEKTHASSAEAAMQNVLNRLLSSKHPEADLTHPPPEYMWQSYKNFIPILVRQINQKMASNWYKIAKKASSPSDFYVGELPKGFKDPDVEYQVYSRPKDALVIDVNDLVGWRYSHLKLPVGIEAKNVPVRRSLLEKPFVGKVTKKDDQNLYIQWEGESHPKPYPMRHIEYLIILKNVV